MIKNKTGLSGKTTALFSKKANPTIGAASGYADLLVGLKGWGVQIYDHPEEAHRGQSGDQFEEHCCRLRQRNSGAKSRWPKPSQV